MTEPSALLPCPFCGSPATAIGPYGGEMLFGVQCLQCNARVSGFDQCEQDARDAWNTRATPTQGEPKSGPGWVERTDEEQIDALNSRVVEVIRQRDALVKELAEAIAVIEDCVGYEHSGDPLEENAFDMGELDIHAYAKDGRLERARTALKGSR